MHQSEANLLNRWVSTSTTKGMQGIIYIVWVISSVNTWWLHFLNKYNLCLLGTMEWMGSMRCCLWHRNPITRSWMSLRCFWLSRLWRRHVRRRRMWRWWRFEMFCRWMVRFHAMWCWMWSNWSNVQKQVIFENWYFKLNRTVREHCLQFTYLIVENLITYTLFQRMHLPTRTSNTYSRRLWLSRWTWGMQNMLWTKMQLSWWMGRMGSMRWSM